MKIVKGIYKGKKLIYQQNGTRPTKQRVLEAMFNVLQEDIQEATVLDACCGTGAFGLEALSRGAKYVCFIDTQISLLKKNTKDIFKNFSIIKSSIENYIAREKKKFDIIFFDPPWDNEPLYQTVIEEIILNDRLINPGGYFFCEHPKELILNFKWKKRYSYGKTQISLYRKD